MVFLASAQTRHSELIAFVAAGLAAWSFIAVYWVLLWRGSVRWNSQRVFGTLIATVVVAVGGALVAMAANLILPDLRGEFGVLCASMLIPIAWLIVTIFLWRETAFERRSRLAASPQRTVGCPTCGYNLTGLTATRCPECGKQCTLDELFAAQAEPQSADLER
jgi:hypothetical protein